MADQGGGFDPEQQQDPSQGAPPPQFNPTPEQTAPPPDQGTINPARVPNPLLSDNSGFGSGPTGMGPTPQDTGPGAGQGFTGPQIGGNRSSGGGGGAPPQQVAPADTGNWQGQFDALNKTWQNDWNSWQTQYANDQKALQQANLAYQTRDLDIRQQQNMMQNQIAQGQLDLQKVVQSGNQAYQSAMLDTRNHELAMNAANQAMTRDVQLQDIALRQQQGANSITMEREKTDLQRRLLPASRTARRAATVQIS